MLLPFTNMGPWEGHWVPISLRFFPDILPNTYLISEYGLVYDIERDVYLPQNLNYNKDKYITISLRTIDGRGCYAQPHRIVGYHFLYQDGCEKLQINHKDCVKYHNWVENLVWMTPLENTRYAMEYGNFKFGQERKLTKLTDQQALDICNMLEQGMSPKEISQIYSVEGVNILKVAFNIRNGHCWDHISKNYKFRNRNRI